MVLKLRLASLLEERSEIDSLDLKLGNKKFCYVTLSISFKALAQKEVGAFQADVCQCFFARARLDYQVNVLQKCIRERRDDLFKEVGGKTFHKAICL